MTHTVDQMARALARREVIRAIAEQNVLIFDLDDVETAVDALMQHKNFHADALLYVNEWARLDSEEERQQSNVISMR